MNKFSLTILAIGLLVVFSSAGQAALVVQFPNNQDIGTMGGSYSFDGTGTHTIVADGDDIWVNDDAFHFAFQEMTEDNIFITARILDLTPGVNGWSKMGVMVRDSLDDTSTHGTMIYTPGPPNGNHRQSAQWRETTGGGSGSYDGPTGIGPYPHWVRVQRDGNQVRHWYSEDSTNGTDGTWIQPGAARTISYTDSVFVGLCVTSHNAGNYVTGVFDNVDIRSYGALGTMNWVGPVSGGLWSNAASWSPAGPPDTETQATIPNHTVTVQGTPASPDVAYSLDVQGGGVTIDTDAELSIETSVNFAPGSTLTMNNNATLITGNDPLMTSLAAGSGRLANVSTNGNATFNTVSGVMTVAGTYNANNVPGTLTKQGSGLLGLDNSDGTSVDLAQTAVVVEGGTLKLKGGGTNWKGGATSFTLAGGALSIGYSLAPGAANGLSEWYFDGDFGDEQLDPIYAGSGFLAMSPDAQTTLDTNLNFDGSMMYNRSGGVIGAAPYDDFGAVWVGYITVGGTSPLAAGDVSFGTDSDEGSVVWVDGQLVVDNKGLHGVGNPQTGNINLAAGDHEIVIGMYEQDGGELIATRFAPGVVTDYNLMTGNFSPPMIPDYVNPASGAQAGIWTGAAMAYPQVVGTTFTVSGPGSGIQVAAPSIANLNVEMQDGGTLATLPGPAGGYNLSANVATGAQYVGFDPQAPTTYTINANNQNVAIAKVGTTTWVLGADPVTLAQNSTWQVDEGVLQLEGTDPLGGRDIKVVGGELLLADTAAPLNGAPVELAGGMLTVAGELVEVLNVNWSFFAGGNSDANLSGIDDGAVNGQNGGLFGIPPTSTGVWTGPLDDPAGRGDNYAFMWHGTLNAQLDGVYTFFTQADDHEILWLDANQNGDFELTPPAPDASEQITENLSTDPLGWNVEKTGTVTLTAGQSYDFAYAYYEIGGGEFGWIDWTPPGGTRRRMTPTSLAGVDFTGANAIDWTVTADSTLNARTNETARFSAPLMKAGILTTVADTGGNIVLEGVNIDPTATRVGFDPQSPTDYNVIDANGAAVTIVKGGSSTMVLDQAPIEMDNAVAWQVEDGTLQVPGNPALLGTTGTGDPVPMNLAGGELFVDAEVTGYQAGLFCGALAGNMSFAANPHNFPIDPLGPTASELQGDPGTPPWAPDATVVYTGEFYFSASGVASFFENIDDVTWLEIDGQLVLDNNAWDVPTAGVITRPEGWYPFELRMSNGGGGTGRVGNLGFGYQPTDTGGVAPDPDGSPTYILPRNTNAVTADLFRIPERAAIDWTTVPMTVMADSTLRTDSDVASDFGHLTLEDGELTVIGHADGTFFIDTTVAPGATAVGFNLTTPTDIGPIEGSSASATFSKRGAADLVLTDRNTGVDNLTFEVAGGRLIGLATPEEKGNPFGAATLQIAVGETVLASDTQFADITFDNPLVVTGDGTLTAGSGGVGENGPLTITLGNATGNNVTLTAGTVTVRNQDNYELKIPGTVSGAGNMDVTSGKVMVGQTINIGDLSLVGGTLEAGDAITADNLNVSSPLILTGTGAQKNITINPEGTLNLIGSNLVLDGATLTVPEATVNIGFGRTLAYEKALTVGSLNVAGTYAAWGTAPGSRDITVNPGGALTVKSTAVLNLTGATSGTLTTTGSDVVVEGGVLKVDNDFEANNVTVSDGGRMDTDGKHVTVHEVLQLGGNQFTREEGPFQASGPDFLRDVELTIEGGTLTVFSAPTAQLTGMDLGGSPLAGSYSFDQGTGQHTIIGDGIDIWNANDQGHFAYLPVTGDVDVIAHVINLVEEPAGVGINAWAKAGVMVRDDLTGGSMHSFTPVTTSNGVPAQGRTAPDAATQYNIDAGGGQTAPYWVRITYDGTTATHYRSVDPGTTPVDSVNWEQIHQQATNLADENYVGLAITSHDDYRLARSLMENVYINGILIGPPPGLVVNQPGTDILCTATTEIVADTNFDAVFGNLTLQPGADLTVTGPPAVSFNDVTTGPTATITLLDQPPPAPLKGGLFIRGVVSPGGNDPGVLTVDGVFELGDFSGYACDLADWNPDTNPDPWNENPPLVVNDKITITGNLEAYLAGTLTLRATSKLRVVGQFEQQWYGDQTRTIMDTVGESTISDWGAFLDVPAAGTHLGHGVFATDQGANGQPVTQTFTTVKVDVFQAADGDGNGDRYLNSDDILAILGANTFGTGLPADWGTGDYNADGICNSDDIQAILATNLWDPFSNLPYAAAVEPGDPGDGVVELMVDPADGMLVISADDVTINSYVIKSSAGIFTGEAADNLGFFVEDTDTRVSGSFAFTLLGQHELGRVIGSEWEILAKDDVDLTFTYTVRGAGGTFEGNLIIIPEPGTVVMLLTGAVGLLLLALRRRSA